MPRMSQTDAKALANDLRNMGINDNGIRSRLTGEGLSYSEATNLISTLPKRKNDDAYQFSAGYKPKNGYKANSDYQYVERFERGGCLTAWLSFQAIATFASFFVACATVSQVSGDAGGFSLLIIVIVGIVGIFQLACIGWLWDGQRKGYQGLLVLYAVGMIANVAGGQGASIMSSLLGIIIIFALVNSKEHLLE